mgnify:FL=1
MEHIRVAQIVNTHGVRGEVRVRSLTDFPDVRFAPGKQLLLKPTTKPGGQVRTVVVERSRPHKQWWLLKFADFDSLNAVEPFKGSELWAPADEALPLAEGEYLFRDIIGCRVWTTDGRDIGVVQNILRPGANDVWVVRDGQKEYLIPYIDDVVRRIDVTARRIVIYPMPGLLEDEE